MEHMRDIAAVVVDQLRAPAIVALQEMQDSSGPVSDGTVDATTTLDSLSIAVRRAGGPGYVAREVAPRDGSDGGIPGGNIRVAVLYDSTRVACVARGTSGADAGTWPVPSPDGVALTISPGRIDPGNAAWLDSRKPLAVEFRVDGVTLILVVCHFTSRSGTTPEFGARQPPVDPRTDKRFRQAVIVRDFVLSVLGIDPAARVIVAGDFNDDIFSGALAPLSSSTALYDLHWRLPEEERYSYLYQGNAHAYDRILVSPALVAGATVDIVHGLAGISGAASDHDPVVASVLPARTATPEHRTGVAITSIQPNPSWGPVTIAVDAPGAECLSATVHDARGRRVRRGDAIELQNGALVWDGHDDTGRRVASGVYIVRVRGSAAAAAGRVVRIPTRH
jgi:hypothetical protein